MEDDLAAKGSGVNPKASRAIARVEVGWLIMMGFDVSAMAAICAVMITSSTAQARNQKREQLAKNREAIVIRLKP